MAGKRLRFYLISRPLLTYSMLYVLVTLSFATMYWKMPGQFYHSTAMYEPLLKRDEELIHSGLQKALLEQGRKNHGSKKINFNGSEFPIETFTVLDVKYEKDQFIIRSMLHNESLSMIVPPLIIVARDEDDWLVEKSDERAIIPAMFEQRKRDFQEAESRQMDVDVFNSDEVGSAEAMPAPAPWLGGDLEPFVIHRVDDTISKAGALAIPRSLFDVMNGYADAKDGFAGMAVGSFFRMLYLSTVTITTVGFGDIVPITPLARTLIAAEAVVGMLVIGLYLNALSQRLGPSNPS